MRVAPLVVLLLCLTLAAPATAHDLGRHPQRLAARARRHRPRRDGEHRRVGRGHRGRGPAGDLVRHRAHAPTTPPTRRSRSRLQQFKLVYAYANDRPNRFAALEGRAAGGRVADRALHGRAVGRPQDAALRHGHRLRRRVRRHPGRRPAGPAVEVLLARPGRAQGRRRRGRPRHLRRAQRDRAGGPAVERRRLVRDRRELAHRDQTRRRTTRAGCSPRCGCPTRWPRRARAPPAAGGRRGSCTSSRTTSAPSADRPALVAVRPLLRRPRRHVLRRRRPPAAAHDRLPADPGRDEPGLRLRRRRLLQRGPGGRHVPGHEVEHVQQPLPRELRRGGAGLRRHDRPGLQPAAARLHHAAGRQRRSPRGRDAHRLHRRLDERPDGLRLPVGAQRRFQLDRRRRARPGPPTRSLAPTSAGACACG